MLKGTGELFARSAATKRLRRRDDGITMTMKDVVHHPSRCSKTLARGYCPMLHPSRRPMAHRVFLVVLALAAATIPFIASPGISAAETVWVEACGTRLPGHSRP